ncbi:MAG: sn-glycerol-3-phosphate ABC transporter ATP-binding protein UgpC [Acidimicrobiia bacterium]|nr:sn-glycerol-3-phosphate ABC transporter ATP-binding protein UgpC [Acidimicrobiia bacterium]
MADVVLDGVEKEYENGFKAVTDLNLTIEDGEFLVMVGPSGCGKSTTLRMIAGLEDITGGKLMIGGNVVNDVEPKDRDIAMVFQNYALYPHMTVGDNIGFALKLAKTPKDELDARVNDAARVLELTELLDRKPGQLSGGQRQRVAMGRAIVRRPKVFLLDEPLSNLDAKLRVQMRAEITELQREVGVTSFYVTHDQIEAMTMADRVAVINRGLLQQVDPPQKLYDDPDNLFVAAFIGSPSMNLMEGQLDRDGGAIALTVGSQTLEVPASVLAARPALEGYFGRTIVAGIRPKELEDASLAGDHPAGQRLRGKIENVEALGFERIVHFEMDAVPVVSEDALELPEDIISAELGGYDDVKSAHPSRVAGRFDAMSTVRPGDMAEVAVSVERIHYFDLDSGLAVRS